PLNVILGLSEALQEEVYGSLNAKQLETLRTIEESGRHLLELINDILDLSKIEAGKLELAVDTIFVGTICHAAMEFIKHAAQKKRLKVSLTLDAGVNQIRADGRRLKQILVNLLANAVKFTHEGGEIGLKVNADAERQALHFTVWDNGIGISPEDMVKLFKPFVQLDSKLSRQHSGTGLGLALVYRMVELHGGSVAVESEAGNGSRFTISLPWPESNKTEGDGSSPPERRTAVEATSKNSDGTARPIESPASVPALGSKEKQALILLAEDNEEN